MYRRNSVILRERMVNHIREGIDQYEHLPTQGDYVDYINRYKSLLDVHYAEQVGYKLAEAGSYYVYQTDVYLLLKEMHDGQEVMHTGNGLMEYYFDLVGQAFRDIENDRFPLEGDTP